MSDVAIRPSRSLAPEIRVLRDENEFLREQVRQLRQQLGFNRDAGFLLQCHDRLGLTKSETLILRMLMVSRAVSRQALYYGYCDDPDDPIDPKIIDVMICKVRAKLRPHDIHIETIWGEGYRLPVKERVKLEAILEDDAVAA